MANAKPMEKSERNAGVHIKKRPGIYKRLLSEFSAFKAVYGFQRRRSGEEGFSFAVTEYT